VKTRLRTAAGALPVATAAQEPGQATVRIGPIQTLPELLRQLGADPATVLRDAEVDPALFDDPDKLISYAARSRLLNHCVAATGCRHFTHLLCQQTGLHSLGLVGLLVKYSPDVGTALRSLVRHLHIHGRGSAVGLTVDRDKATFSFGLHLSRLESTEQVGDGAVTMMFNVMRGLCGPAWRPVEVRFAHRKPQDVEPYRRYFQATLRYDAEQYALVFPARWLVRPLPETDPDVRRLLQQQIDAIEAEHGDDFPARVRSVLRTALLTSQAGADQVAALFSMHSRTMNRRLHAFGTSFRLLVAESRFGIARQLLESSALDVSEIAEILDYSDASAFTRAFRLWSGTTPARWRSDRQTSGGRVATAAAT
jgi:AraC-like DNA-binding protein